MNVRFQPTPLSTIREELERHLASLPSTIDSYLEDHILQSAHYRATINGEPAGFASIHAGSLITQFSLNGEYRRYGQEAFRAAKTLETVHSAYVPTCDGFYLSHALDDYRALAKQAYLFSAAPEAPDANLDTIFITRFA